MPKLKHGGCDVCVATGHTSWGSTSEPYVCSINVPVLHSAHPWVNPTSWPTISDHFLVDRQLCWQRVPCRPREYWRSDRGQRQSQRGQVPPGETKGTVRCGFVLGKKLFQRVFWLCLGVFLTKDIFSQSPDNFRSEQLITPREGQHLNRVDEIFAQQLQDMLKLVVPGWVRPVEMCLGACMLHDVATHMVEGIAHICVSWCL